MSEASFASLGPTLLARKGGAKPAMRPQLAPLPELVADEQLEDLGWNDMGQEDENGAEDSIADIVSISPKTKSPEAANEDVADQPASESPLVRKQQETLAKRVEADVAAAKAKVKADTAKTKRSKAKSVASKAAAKAKRAAFTLRLDTDRHLKLRLAATMQGVSAQALVTDALDAMLGEIDDLDALATRMNGLKKPT